MPGSEPSVSLPVREYLRAVAYLRPYRRRLLFLFATGLFSSVVTLVQPYLTKLLIDEALLHRNYRGLWLLAVWMGVCAGVSFVLGIFTTQAYTRLSAAVLFDMRAAVFHQLQQLSPQYFAKTKTGDIVSRLNNDIAELQRLSSDTILSLPSHVFFLLGSAGMMAWLNPGLFLLSVALVPAGIWAMRHYQGRLRDEVKGLRERSSEIGSFLIEAILGMRLIVCSNAQTRTMDEFRTRNDRFVDSLLKMQVTSFLAGALPGAVMTATVAGLFLYGGNLVIRGVLTLGSLMAFMAYHGRLLSPVQSLMGSYSALITGSVSLRRVLELLDMPVTVQDPEHPIALAARTGAVQFRDVSFGYADRGPVLRRVSFDAPPKGLTVLVGASGAGKSTILDLLLRFYDVSSGSVLIDGVNVTSVRLKDLRDHVAVVEQTPFLFHATIAENLRFAAIRASDADVVHAACAAGIHDFIASLPEGYQTVLGERGQTISAGQRQRIAIARALLRRPAILALDEPTAALDPDAEWRLGEILRGLTSQCTVIVVTHRPALVEMADHVVVLDQGQVVEEGVPAELLATGRALVHHFRETLSAPAPARL